jgi:fructose-specific phosphotransferase system IIC component
MGPLGLPELLILLIVFGGGALWVWMIIDCAINEPSGTDKIVWILIILLGSCIGAFIYLLVRRPRRMEQIGK